MLSAEWPEVVFVLIPAYKSADLLRKFLPDLLCFVPEKQICVVDDASGDNTYDLCKDLKIDCIRHEVNKGKGAALRTGFSFLLKKGAAWVITMDADGQHSPDDLHRFISAISKDPDIGICIGARKMVPGAMPFLRICSNRLTSWILSLFTGVNIRDSQCGYRIYSAAFLSSVTIDYERFEMESEVIIKAVRSGFKICFTEVQTLYLSDLSHISHLCDTFRWVKAVIRTNFKYKTKNQANDRTSKSNVCL